VNNVPRQPVSSRYRSHGDAVHYGCIDIGRRDASVWGTLLMGARGFVVSRCRVQNEGGFRIFQGSGFPGFRVQVPLIVRLVRFHYAKRGVEDIGFPESCFY
jgi:hypothetical protein